MAISSCVILAMCGNILKTDISGGVGLINRTNILYIYNKIKSYTEFFCK